MLDGCCSKAQIPSSAGIKTIRFTAPGDIINLLYRSFRKIKKSDKISYIIRYPETIIQYIYLHHNILKLRSKFTILLYTDA
jgi:hypothetical protein